MSYKIRAEIIFVHNPYGPECFTTRQAGNRFSYLVFIIAFANLISNKLKKILTATINFLICHNITSVTHQTSLQLRPLMLGDSFPYVEKCLENETTMLLKSYAYVFNNINITYFHFYFYQRLLMNSTEPFILDSAEIPHAHPNTTCNFEAYRS